MLHVYRMEPGRLPHTLKNIDYQKEKRSFSIQRNTGMIEFRPNVDIIGRYASSMKIYDDDDDLWIFNLEGIIVSNTCTVSPKLLQSLTNSTWTSTTVFL